MKERPILFNSAMVRAILDGRKSQTRRVIVPTMAPRVAPRHLEPCSINGKQVLHVWAGSHADYPSEKWFICPYGAPGDRLWVRETWAYVGPGSGSDRPEYVEQTKNPENHTLGNVWYKANEMHAFHASCSPYFRWSPSIHMPRWASRLTMEVTGVRVERVQSISEGDAKVEGVKSAAEFCALWDEINGKRGYGWDANPWVWVVEFKRVAEGDR